MTPEILLSAYGKGIFPMADSRDDPEVFWVEPKLRGVLPIDGFHLSRSLARTMRRGTFTATLNADFDGVVEGCADRPETWINTPIFNAYRELHARGHAHSLEIWSDGALVGGVYGVTLGAAFFGESMFSRSRDASKVALAVMVAQLAQTGFILFDTQFLTAHLASLGGVEVPRGRYLRMLQLSQTGEAPDLTSRPLPDLHSVVQRITQTSNRE